MSGGTRGLVRRVRRFARWTAYAAAVTLAAGVASASGVWWVDRVGPFLLAVTGLLGVVTVGLVLAVGVVGLRVRHRRAVARVRADGAGERR